MDSLGERLAHKRHKLATKLKTESSSETQESLKPHKNVKFCDSSQDTPSSIKNHHSSSILKKRTSSALNVRSI